jgi:hypothetical protein
MAAVTWGAVSARPCTLDVASPQIGGDDSPRGFVPFRSLQSYENLLSLQAQTR